MEVEHAYNHCLRVARRHYENFPVASLLLPPAIRAPVAVIYAFARTADDLADEGNLTAEERLARLDAFGRELDAALAGHDSRDPVLRASANLISSHALPVALFHDLITAFRMDITKKRYANFTEVMAYCRYSANPVGRLILHLTDQATPRNLKDSDHICSALQLINFLQDMDQDYRENDRIYLPQDQMSRLGVEEKHFRDQLTDDAMRMLFRQEVRRTRELMLEGASIGLRLPGRLGLEIRAIVAGGLRVLRKLEDLDADVFVRPRLTGFDRLWLIWHAFLRRPPSAGTAL